MKEIPHWEVVDGKGALGGRDDGDDDDVARKD